LIQVEGIIPAMVTPFTDDGKIHEAVLRRMVRRFLDAGVSGLFCLGTNGEFYSLSEDEKVRVTAIVADEADGKVPVYAGAGAISTDETVRLASQLERAGADALSVITPYFLSFTQQELYEHYVRIAESTRLPIVLYNIPSRTSNTLHPKTVAKLAEIPNIVGLKDSSGSFDLTLQYIDQTPDTFAVLAGTDSLILATLMAGGKGAVAATANVFPAEVVSIYRHWKEQRFREAEEAQRLLRDLRASFSLGTLPSVLKAVLTEIGLSVGPARRPVAPLTDSALAHVKEMVASYERRGLIRRKSGTDTI